jgi:hypothetical protein
MDTTEHTQRPSFYSAAGHSHDSLEILWKTTGQSGILLALSFSSFQQPAAPSHPSSLSSSTSE